MRDQLNKLLEKPFSDVKNDSEKVLILLSLYSRLFMDGKQPSTCVKCMADYYIKLSNEGFARIEKMKIMENQKCKLKPGLVFVKEEAKHFSNDNITDKKALQLLNSGRLKPQHFEILPDGYKKDVDKITLTKKNKGKFTAENLDQFKAVELMEFAREVTDQKPNSGKKSIKAILEWQK